MDLLEKTELLLQRQDYAGAERHARPLIGTGVADVAAQARRLLIEALIGLEAWPEAAREVNDWAHGPDGPRLQVGEVVDLIHNAGLAAATQMLIGRPEPAEVAHRNAVPYSCLTVPGVGSRCSMGFFGAFFGTAPSSQPSPTARARPQRPPRS